jgi:hypothetical protein
MEKLRQHYESIFGCKPSAKELQSLEHFMTRLGIRENDAILLFFLFEERNLQRLSEIPKRIEHAALRSETAARARCDAVAQESIRHTVTRLLDEIASQIDRVVATRERMRFTRGVVAATMFALTGFAAAAAGGYVYGHDRALTIARGEAIQASAANEALRTPEGQRVFRWYLQHPSSVRALMDCNRPGWIKEGVACYPERNRGRQLYGWAILPEAP